MQVMELPMQNHEATAAAVKTNLMQILQENTRLAEAIDYSNFGELTGRINAASAIFFIASGRSGFAMRAVAMRLMHLGLRVFFVGETITPAIQKGDLLWAASGSGTTSTIVKAAQKAKHVGADVLAMTTNPASTLAGLADLHILIPAAEKEDHNGAKSTQYAGSLFEQAVLLVGDAVFAELWKLDGTPAEELYKRHSNME
jgi:6-phospho-3-hexuloisomerase